MTDTRDAAEIADTSAIAALTAERDQLKTALLRTINETGARLRVLMVLTQICQNTLTALEPQNNAIVNEAINKMRPLLNALASLPPLTRIAAQTTGTMIVVPPELIESIDRYLERAAEDPKPKEEITRIAMLNAVAFIGERLIELYQLTKEPVTSPVTSPVTPPT